jgi:hypothetical protein
MSDPLLPKVDPTKRDEVFWKLVGQSQLTEADSPESPASVLSSSSPGSSVSDDVWSLWFMDFSTGLGWVPIFQACREGMRGSTHQKLA